MTLFLVHDYIVVLYFDNYYYLIFRYLHKVFNQKLPQSQLPGDVSYLASDFYKHIQSGAVTSQQFSDPQLLLEAYRQRARRYLHVHRPSLQIITRYLVILSQLMIIFPS